MDGMGIAKGLIQRPMPIITSHARRQHHTLERTAAILNFRFKIPLLLSSSAATNKSDFRQIAEASPNLPWIMHLALCLAILLCVLSVTRYQVYSADCDPR